MGRWSGFKLNTNHGKHIHIITVYQSTKSDGIHTNYTQQLEHLNQSGSHCLDPRKQLLMDLQQVINQNNYNHEHSIILIDANDGLYTKQYLLPNFLHQTNMIPLITNPENYPPSYSRGSHCIDFIFGTPNLINHVT